MKKMMAMTLVGWALSARVEATPPTPFLTNAAWDSGAAEFQTYRARMTKYGIPRDTRATLILVKEPFRTDRMVKAGASENADTEVLKMNFIQDIPTGVYTYHQMISFFFDRSGGQLLKMAMSSQDGCGTTYVRYHAQGEKHSFATYSYFDDEGEQIMPWEGPAPVFYDSLPLVLRFRMDETSYPLNLLPSLLSNRAPKLEPTEAIVLRGESTTIRTAGGSNLRVIPITVTQGTTTDTLLFAEAFPHALVQWTQGDGDTLNLDKDLHMYYWQHTRPDDVRLLGDAP